jgi:hypothetical protein
MTTVEMSPNRRTLLVAAGRIPTMTAGHDLAQSRAAHRRPDAGGAKPVFPSPDVCEHTARQFTGNASDDDSLDGQPNLAWNALLRLVELRYPDYKDLTIKHAIPNDSAPPSQSVPPSRAVLIASQR